MTPAEAILGFGGGVVGIIILAMAIVAGVLWLFLPFAVFGIKDRLNRMIKAAERTNEMLAALGQQQTAHHHKITQLQARGQNTPSRPASAVRHADAPVIQHP